MIDRAISIFVIGGIVVRSEETQATEREFFLVFGELRVVAFFHRAGYF